MAESVGWGPYLNGSIPASAMTDIGGGWLLESTAARQHAGARAEILRDYGWDLNDYISETYRDLAGQVYWKEWWSDRGKPNNAATPGYSQHGKGRAEDYNEDALRRDGRYEIAMAVLAKYGLKRDVSGEGWHVTFKPEYVSQWASLEPEALPIELPKGKMTMRVVHNYDDATGGSIWLVIVQPGKPAEWRVLDETVDRDAIIAFTGQPVLELKTHQITSIRPVL